MYLLGSETLMVFGSWQKMSRNFGISPELPSGVTEQKMTTLSDTMIKAWTLFAKGE